LHPNTFSLTLRIKASCSTIISVQCHREED
jgi:hypothetical protein